MPHDHTRAPRPAPRQHATDTLSDLAPVMRVNGPAALVQAVPYLIGFHPSDSVVVVGLQDGVLVVTARIDLAPAGCDADLAHALDVLLRSGVTEIVAVVYSDDPAARDVRAARATLVALLDAGHTRLLDTLVVWQDRWRSLDCADASCCPVEGRRLDEQTSEFAAAATFAGVVAHPDRDSLAAIVQPGDAASRQAVARLIAESHDDTTMRDTTVRGAVGKRTGRDLRAKRALFAAARAADAECTHYSTQPSDADAAQFAVWLADIGVRDSVWMAVDDGRLDGRPLWAALARRVPSPYDAAPSFLYGWAAWRDGNGAMALIAARRALEADPGYTAADLLLAALNRGIDPRAVPKLRRARG